MKIFGIILGFYLRLESISLMGLSKFSSQQDMHLHNNKIYNHNIIDGSLFYGQYKFIIVWLISDEV